MSALPEGLALNAWTGSEAARGELDPRASRWGSGGGLPGSQARLDLGEPPDWTKWGRADVGYGVLLPESAERTAAERAAGADAPRAVRELLAARPGTVMLRWDAELEQGKVRRYFPDGRTQTPQIGMSKYGVGLAALPRYVVIVGGPEVIPWSVQYELGTHHYVGRLPLAGDELDNYVNALLNGWADAELDVRAPLMWTVDLPGDITAEMRAVIANPLAIRFTDDQLPRFRHITDGDALGGALLAQLAAARPALVFTSSHGLTEGAPEAMALTLGLPVDQAHQPVALDALDAAMPGGALWHAQACCSAGSEGPSKYLGLLGAGTSAVTTLAAVAALGSTVAPAARRLLGRHNPVRAVIGHVEPTFDWTLRIADTGQGLGNELVAGLSTNLYAGQPVGYALSEYRSKVGEIHTRWVETFERLNAGHLEARPELTRLRLTALDRQSLVLLGDPTVTLPPLAGAP